MPAWSREQSTAALAVGYFVGGCLADRQPSLSVLGVTVVAGSLYLTLVPFFADVVLEWIARSIEDVRTGSLLASFVLMFVPITFFGMYSPYAIRIILDTTTNAGMVSGTIYGCSTVGSIVGTIGTAFFLIPIMGTRAITVGLGILGVASGLGLVLAGRAPGRTGLEKVIGCCLGSIVFLAALWARGLPATDAEPAVLNELVVGKILTAPDGILARIETEYNNIFISKRGRYVRMSFVRQGNDYTESISNLRDPGELPVEYTQVMTAGLAYPNKLQSILMIGMGGGSLSTYLAKFMPDVELEVVDLDPGVFEAAQKYFGVQAAGRVSFKMLDGRMHIARTAKTYDVILMDAFRGGYVPFHLLTQEFYIAVRNRLSVGGVVVFNVHRDTQLYDSTIKTQKSIFPLLHMYNAGGNIVTIAGRETNIDEAGLAARAMALQSQYKFRYPLDDLTKGRLNGGAIPDVKILTDDFAPAEFLDVIKKYNAKRW